MSKEKTIKSIMGMIALNKDKADMLMDLFEQTTKPLQEENDILKDEQSLLTKELNKYRDDNDILKADLLLSEQKVKLNYTSLVDAINENEQLKLGISELKARISELESVNNEIIELFSGIGVPNINWILNKLTEVNKQSQTT